MRIIGMDIGFGFTKVVSPEGVHVFPSVVGSYDEDTLEVTGMKPPDLQASTVVVDGYRLIVGDSAIRYAGRMYSVRDRGWIESLAYRTLILHSMRVSGMDTSPDMVTIITGLPVSHYRTYRERLIKLIKKLSRRNVEVKVLVQPLGSYFDCMLDDNAEVKDEELIKGRIGIIDIGFYTTDFITIQELEFVRGSYDSLEGGISSAYERMARDVYNEFDVRKDVHEMERVVKDGFVKVYGERKDIGGIKERRLRELSREIEAKVKTLWKDGRDIDCILYTGGGVEVLKEYLDFFRHSRFVHDPQIANARGYVKFGRRMIWLRD